MTFDDDEVEEVDEVDEMDDVRSMTVFFDSPVSCSVVTLQIKLSLFLSPQHVHELLKSTLLVHLPLCSIPATTASSTSSTTSATLGCSSFIPHNGHGLNSGNISFLASRSNLNCLTT